MSGSHPDAPELPPRQRHSHELEPVRSSFELAVGLQQNLVLARAQSSVVDGMAAVASR
jgi:hypothetical protein